MIRACRSGYLVLLLLGALIVAWKIKKQAIIDQINAYEFERALASLVLQRRGNVFNLSRSLEPAQVYDAISCQELTALDVSTTLCNYDRKTDLYAQVNPWFKGLREPEAFENFLQILIKHPDLIVFDFGVFVGQYTLFAAKLKHRVFSVEAFYDNLLHIHKGAVFGKVSSYITLFHNGIADKSGEIKRLEPMPGHLAMQNLVKYQDKVYTRENASDTDKKYLVETITMDDLASYVPRNAHAVMKIDIEGFEARAFQRASRLFEVVDFCCVFMEWAHQAEQQSIHSLIFEMMEFLYSRDFKAYEHRKLTTVNELKRDEWKSWPIDIVWKKKGY